MRAGHPDRASGQDERDPLIGSTLGGYRITGVLGRGGYAVVYRAVQTQLGREVALKVLREDPEQGGHTDAQVDAFLREARAAAALNHRCLVHVHDVGEAEGRHYLSMELVPGGNLASHLRAHGPMHWREAAVVMRDIAQALECAHAHRMVHRDVKPANILLTEAGSAKLADLGLAGSEQLHAGTAAFMAPEQALRRKVGRRSDLYSLGCSAFAMLTGQAPFQRASSKEMLLAHVREEAPSLKSTSAKVPADLERLVAQLLAKPASERPGSAAEVAERLDRMLGQGPGLRRSRRSPRSRSRRDRRRRGGWYWAGIVLMLLLLLALAAALVWWYAYR